jgi:hypothetical protein
VCDFGPMATQTSKPHSSAVGCDFLNSYEGAPAMRGNKVPRYGTGVTPSGAAHYPKILRTGADQVGVVVGQPEENASPVRDPDPQLLSASPSSRPDEGNVRGNGTCTP